MLSFPSFEGVCFGFKPLGHDNYSQWQPSMIHLLSIQGIWEIVNGQVTKSELDHQGFELRDKLAVALIQATVDLHVHPWVSGQFTSSKELWDSIKCKLQRRKKKKKPKKKKKDKKQEPVLVVRSEISHLVLHVPEIHDSPVSNCLENFLEEAACMENAQVLDRSDFLHTSQVSNLHTICENDCSLILKDVAAQRDEGTTILRDKDYLLEVEENGIESVFFDQLSQDIIQQLEVPIIDDYFEVAGLSSLLESFMYIPEYAAAELILECDFRPSKGTYESMYQKLEWFPSRNDHLSHASLASWDEVFEHQVHTADFKHELADELVVDLPWLNVDAKASVFDTIMSQVPIQQQQQLDLPLYICLNVPFSCTHGGKLEGHPNLDHCLGYISYFDIGGSTKQLKVSYKCLHLRNQVLLVLEDSDLSMHGENLLVAEDSHEIMSAGQFSEFQHNISTAGANAGVLHDYLGSSSAEVSRGQSVVSMEIHLLFSCEERPAQKFHGVSTK